MNTTTDIDYLNISGRPNPFYDHGDGCVGFRIRHRWYKMLPASLHRPRAYVIEDTTRLPDPFRLFDFPWAMVSSPASRRAHLTNVLFDAGVDAGTRFIIALALEKCILEEARRARAAWYRGAAPAGFEVIVELDMVNVEVIEEEEEEEDDEQFFKTLAALTAIGGLKKEKYCAPNGGEDGPSAAVVCAVCLEEFLGGDECSRLPCQHVFHYACIVPWLRKDPSCPLCRSRNLLI